MTGFEELVERARRELTGTGAADRAPNAAGPRQQAYLDSQARFRADLARLLAEIERNSRVFDLRADDATTPLRRWLARALAGALRLGGLGKHLGANQLRANQATLGALRLLQARMLEQDRVLAELAAAPPEREGRASPDGVQP